MISKKYLWHIFKATISIAAIIVIVNSVDIQKSLEAVKTASIKLLLLSILITIIEQLVIAHKWIILLKVKNFTISIWQLLNINLIAGFWGLFLPSSLSIDILRGYYLVKNESSKGLSASSIIVDRVMGILSLLFVAIIGVLISGSLLSGINVKPYIFLLTSIIIIFVFLIFREKTFLFVKKYLVLKKNKIYKKLLNLYNIVFDFKKYPKTLIESFLLSVTVQILRIVAIYYISEAYYLNIGIIYFFILVPITMITVMLPISVGGIGVREGSFIAFFSLVGLSFDDAILISLTITLKVVLFSLVGGILYLFHKSSIKQAES